MSNKGTFLNDELYSYLQTVSVRPQTILQELRETTLTLPNSIMQISPEQGQFMQLLIKLMGAQRTIEVGVYTGYSALAVALALPKNGEVVACDINKEWTDIAQTYWKKAGVANKIKLHLASAEITLQNLLDHGQQEQFDFAFIDADKTGYARYYEQCLQLLRVGGLIMIDNTFMHYTVLNNDKNDKTAEAIRQINVKLLHDERVDISMVPIGDGVLLARKREI